MSTTHFHAAESTRDASPGDAAFAQFAAALSRFLRTSAPSATVSQWPSPDDCETAFQQLALSLFALQYQSVPPLLQLCRRRRISPDAVSNWRTIPAVPTTAFKDYPVTSLPPDQRTAMFCSSGTTSHRPSRHFHNAASLALYEASLLPWFETHLAPDSSPEQRGLSFLALTPSPTETPESSLAHMFGVIVRTWGENDSAFQGTVGPDGAWHLDAATASARLTRLAAAGRPVCLLGTAFAYVHLIDAMLARGQRCTLPRGSRALETGGYKGRSRVLPKSDLHALMEATLGIARTHVVSEYGMSELSSQAYDAVVPASPGHRACRSFQEKDIAPRERVFHFPPWARALVVSPEHNIEVREGETGLLRVVDLANLRSAVAIQTDDLAVRRGHGFELLGRDPSAEPRGCSLRAADLMTY